MWCLCSCCSTARQLAQPGWLYRMKVFKQSPSKHQYRHPTPNGLEWGAFVPFPPQPGRLGMVCGGVAGVRYTEFMPFNSTVYHVCVDHTLIRVRVARSANPLYLHTRKEEMTCAGSLKSGQFQVLSRTRVVGHRNPLTESNCLTTRYCHPWVAMPGKWRPDARIGKNGGYPK
jgi:hypothetical protein